MRYFFLRFFLALIFSKNKIENISLQFSYVEGVCGSYALVNHIVSVGNSPCLAYR